MVPLHMHLTTARLQSGLFEGNPVFNLDSHAIYRGAADCMHVALSVSKVCTGLKRFHRFECVQQNPEVLFVNFWS